jgi:hypothetical protein
MKRGPSVPLRDPGCGVWRGPFGSAQGSRLWCMERALRLRSGIPKWFRNRRSVYGNKSQNVFKYTPSKLVWHPERSRRAPLWNRIMGLLRLRSGASIWVWRGALRLRSGTPAVVYEEGPFGCAQGPRLWCIERCPFGCAQGPRLRCIERCPFGSAQGPQNGSGIKGVNREIRVRMHLSTLQVNCFGTLSGVEGRPLE